jgi:hypothetical protein
MDISIVNTDVPLLLSPSFVSEVEGVIDRNVDSNVPLVALFILCNQSFLFGNEVLISQWQAKQMRLGCWTQPE